MCVCSEKESVCVCDGNVLSIRDLFHDCRDIMTAHSCFRCTLKKRRGVLVISHEHCLSLWQKEASSRDYETRGSHLKFKLEPLATDCK